MKNIKIAIVDTGVDIEDDLLKNKIKYNPSYQLNSFNNSISDINDINGHGTMCAKTIIEICNDVDIYPIKIFEDSGKTNSLNAITVFNKLLNEDIDIINISASTINTNYKEELYNICDKLSSEGKIIISSLHNRAYDKISYPTIFSNVIGVCGDERITKDEYFIYDKKEKIQMKANINKKLVKFRDSVTDFGRSSRATALTTGIVAKYFYKHGKMSFNRLENLLEEKSVSEIFLGNLSKCKNKRINNPQRKKYETKKINSEQIHKYNQKQILEVINNKFAIKKIDLEFVEKYSIFNNITGIGNYNAYEFLKEINNKFKIVIDYNDLFLYQLEDVDSILQLIEEKTKVKKNN
ncbi:MAG: S8 family serine peptidase [Clostridioides sp.]|jgi:hypothetical protein|nr:S8 family serine peptidase [Clostridioides sp.]